MAIKLSDEIKALLDRPNYGASTMMDLLQILPDERKAAIRRELALLAAAAGGR
jgi:hypothetical protein